MSRRIRDGCCGVAHCRTAAVIVYYDVGLCGRHWGELCDKEQDILMRLKLVRGSDGEVRRMSRRKPVPLGPAPSVELLEDPVSESDLE